MKENMLESVTKDKNKSYHYLFESFGHFENLIRFILHYETYTIMVDDVSNPSTAILQYGPVVFVQGKPGRIDPNIIFEKVQKNQWIVPCCEEWDPYIQAYFEDRIEIHNRVLFDPSSLELKEVLKIKKDLPTGMRIEPISSTHIEDKEGMIYQDLIRKFYINHDFLETGRGIVLLDGDFVVGYAASDNPIVGNDLELMFRVGYDNFTTYRGKGYGILLCVYFIEDCLNNNYVPSWDAANDISAHIALKLGYTKKKKWKMFHIL